MNLWWMHLQSWCCSISKLCYFHRISLFQDWCSCRQEALCSWIIQSALWRPCGMKMFVRPIFNQQQRQRVLIQTCQSLACYEFLDFDISWFGVICLLLILRWPKYRKMRSRENNRFDCTVFARSTLPHVMWLDVFIQSKPKTQCPSHSQRTGSEI